MRRTYLVCYDISDDVRLRKVHRVMRGFGVRLQYSVFRCDVTKREIEGCRSLLLALIDVKRDQILIVDLGRSGNADLSLSAMGRPLPLPDARLFIAD